LAAAEIKQPTRGDILAYKAHLLDQRLSGLTINNYLSSIRQFYFWLEETKGGKNIARNVRGTRPPKGFRKDALTTDQAAKVLLAIDITKPEGLRNYAIINLMLRSGLRCGEIIWTDVGDIDKLQDETILRVWGKGRDGKDEFVILTQAALEPITRYLATRGECRGDDPLFVSESHRNYGGRISTQTLRYAVKTAMRSIGLDSLRLSAHSLRHTALTWSLTGGATIQEAQAMARHASSSTTMGYLHNLERIENSAERKVDKFLQEQWRDNDDS
jgi:integrase/recombinase XerD